MLGTKGVTPQTPNTATMRTSHRQARKENLALHRKMEASNSLQKLEQTQWVDLNRKFSLDKTHPAYRHLVFLRKTQTVLITAEPAWHCSHQSSQKEAQNLTALKCTDLCNQSPK